MLLELPNRREWYGASAQNRPDNFMLCVAQSLSLSLSSVFCVSKSGTKTWAPKHTQKQL